MISIHKSIFPYQYIDNICMLIYICTLLKIIICILMSQKLAYALFNRAYIRKPCTEFRPRTDISSDPNKRTNRAVILISNCQFTTGTKKSFVYPHSDFSGNLSLFLALSHTHSHTYKHMHTLTHSYMQILCATVKLQNVWRLFLN